MIYEQLVHEIKPTVMADWLANDRWYVLENKDNGGYAFCTAPIDRERAQRNGEHDRIMKRTLFFLAEAQPNGAKESKCLKADSIRTDSMEIILPYHEYGAVITANRDLSVKSSTSQGIFHESSTEPVWTVEEHKAVMHDGSYFVCVVTQGKLERCDNGITIHADSSVKTAISFYNHSEKAEEIACNLFDNSTRICEQSKKFWEDYLSSCPIADEGDKDFKLRQYWHWWCLLVNVSHVEFNRFPIYMAPDRQGWFGTWSNDGPECMAALSLTNQKDIAGKIIVSYIGAAINNDGIHAWYLSNDGIPCYGREHDVGCLSQGVPNIVHTVDFYVRQTGDTSILDEMCGGITVYEKLSRYIRAIFRTRDTDGDGLVEWRNLWETGWDDKLGCFFKGAPIEDWIQVAITGTREEIGRFYNEKCYPVISVVEQVYVLWALNAMKSLATVKQDADTRLFCEVADETLRRSFDEKCWDCNAGYYFDYNVREQCRAAAKSLDCFYWLFFEKDQQRIESIFSYLDNPECFGLSYTPMQSADIEGFSPTGYWSGGHWPREMSYLALGLFSAGKTEKARSILKKAIMTGQGSMIYEVLNPYTGQPTTGIARMAYNILDVVVWLCLCGKISWLSKAS